MKLLSFAIPCYNSAEYMEKCILCLIFTDQFLDIVQNQHIHALIKIHEIIRRIFPDGFRILYGKKVS